MKKFLFSLLLVFCLPVLAFAFGSDLRDPDAMSRYFDLAAYVVAGASAVANLTKTDKDDKAVSLLSRLVNFLSLNWFRFVPGDKRR